MSDYKERERLSSEIALRVAQAAYDAGASVSAKKSQSSVSHYVSILWHNPEGECQSVLVRVSDHKGCRNVDYDIDIATSDGRKVAKEVGRLVKQDCRSKERLRYREECLVERLAACSQGRKRHEIAKFVRNNLRNIPSKKVNRLAQMVLRRMKGSTQE